MMDSDLADMTAHLTMKVIELADPKELLKMKVID